MKIQQFTTLKKILIALLLCISASPSIAQNSNGIFFQAVARDNFSNPAKDRNIYVESSILQTTVNGTKVLIELHKTRTDAMGVFNITIGNGQRRGGSSTNITTIDWSKGPFYLNLKIAITPFSASDSWDYSKELVDIGTTSFGAVPFAFYSASSAKVSDKLDATDTTKMLAVYAKAMAVQSLATDVSTKLTAADTLTMLAPYAKAAYTIDSNFFRSQLATKLNITDTINYTKQKYTDSAFSKKLNIADSSSYVTPTKLTANLFDPTLLKNEIAIKLNIADSTKYVTPTKLASYYTSSSGSGTTIDTASLSNRINLKASTSDLTNAIALNTSTIATNTNAITANTTAIAAEATTARAAEIALRNSVSSNTANITSNTADIITNRANITTNTSGIATNTTAITANANAITAITTAITAEATTARAAELVLTNNVSLITTNTTSNTSAIAANTASILTNSSDIELKAPIISPTFTGTPTAPTAAAGINTTQLATTAFVNNATSNISASSISGTVALSKGGTGQTTIAGIQSALGLAGTKVAIGATSGVTSQGSGAVAVGNGTGNNNQGGNSVAIGYVAGAYYQGASSIAIGVNAAQTSQGANAVAIGDVAGQNNQGANSVAIGSNAGQTSQGANSVAIGGYSTSSFTNSIAIGYKAKTTAANTIQLGGDGVIAGSTAITNVKTTGTLTAGTVTYPNAHNSIAGQLLSINATGTAAWATPASSGGTHAIGEVYGGGIIVFTWDGGTHGLIAAISDLGKAKWNDASVTMARANGIGAGLKNTTLIIANLGYNAGASYAAKMCNEYSVDVTVDGKTITYGDWYLPSLFELSQFILNKSYFTGLPTPTYYYWSSNEWTNTSYPDRAMYVRHDGYIDQSQKNSTTHAYVRPFRMF